MFNVVLVGWLDLFLSVSQHPGALMLQLGMQIASTAFQELVVQVYLSLQDLSFALCPSKGRLLL